MKKALIIGGGFAGCAAAHQLQLKGGWDVTLVERAPFLGGGCRTLWYGGHPHTYGPRHFLTKNEEVFAYLDKHLPLRRCAEHEFITYVEKDRRFYSYPIHRNDIQYMPDRVIINEQLAKVTGAENAKNLEEYWVHSVGKTLYEKFVETYSKKMWPGLLPSEIDDFGWSPKGVALKEGPRAAWDTAISAYPEGPDGYDPYFRLATAEANVIVGFTPNRFDIDPRNKTMWVGDERHEYDIIVNTISPDLLFGQCYGKLPYVGRDFYPILLPIEHAFPDNVYFIYYAGNEKHTRLVEYKKFTGYQAPTTLLGMEVPSANGKYYPMPQHKFYDLAQKYFDLMPDGVFSIGRAGSYRYSVDIDDSIEQAINIARAL